MTSPKWNDTISNINVQGYEERLKIAKEIIASFPASKNTFITHYIETGVVCKEELEKHIKNSMDSKNEQDMIFIVIIRFLYLYKQKNQEENSQSNNDVNDLKEKALDSLNSFPFWPEVKGRNMDKIIFWSENHLLMTLGSAHLYYQYVNSSSSEEEEDIEENFDFIYNEDIKLSPKLIDDILLYYLKIHDNMNGVYEVCSHVYLPYSLSALFNLYDFSNNKKIKKYAYNLINNIMEQLCLVLDPVTGTGTLSASARAFPRTRERNVDHNVSQIHYLLIGKSPNNELKFSQVIDFLTTTKWRPLPSLYESIFYDGFIGNKTMNHTITDIPKIYKFQESPCTLEYCDNQNELLKEPISSPLNIAPMLWSCGLVANPNLGKTTHKFIKKYSLKSNEHLWPIYKLFFSSSSFASTMSSYKNFSLGQSYLDIRMNVYKKPNDGLILSSFESFNNHLVSFQQLVWACNFHGVPIYTLSGKGNESFLGFGITDTITPCVKQYKSLLIVNYYKPELFRSMFSISKLIFSTNARLMWPLEYMSRTLNFIYYVNKDNRERKPIQYIEDISESQTKKLGISDDYYIWVTGQRDNCFVGVLCTSRVQLQETSIKFKYDNNNENTKPIHALYNPTTVSHSWVIVADAANNDYKTLKEFCAKRLNKIEINHSYDSNNKRLFLTSVNDPYLNKTLEYRNIQKS